MAISLGGDVNLWKYFLPLNAARISQNSCRYMNDKGRPCCGNQGGNVREGSPQSRGVLLSVFFHVVIVTAP